MSEYHDIIHKAYNDPEVGFVGATALYKKLKKQYPKITIENVIEYYKITNGPDSYQIDLIFFKDSLVRYNKGYIGLLTAIEVTTRKGYAYPIKNKEAAEISRAFNIFIQQAKPKSITSVSDNKIKYTYAKKQDHNKMGMIERFNRTIKKRILKLDNNNWIDNIEKLIKNYNNTEHSATQVEPNKITAEQSEDIRQDAFIHNLNVNYQYSVPIDSYVRVRLQKSVFDKEGAKFSTKIYQVKSREGNSYTVESIDDKETIKNVKHYELQIIDKDKVIKNTEQKQDTIERVQKNKKDTSMIKKQQAEKIGRVDKASGAIVPENWRWGVVDQPRRVDSRRPTTLRLPQNKS